MDLSYQSRRVVAVVAIALGFLTLAAFWPVLHNDFIRYDDPVYVTSNPHISQGITAEGLAWALSSGYASNWHPITWVSHMLDVQLFGFRPAWHHFVNLAIHTTNAILLLFLLFRLAGSVWRSAFVAALFALHPLHVESVAWVSERKDVLSMLFLLLTVWMYANYTRLQSIPAGSSKARRMYLFALGFFALGLMSKPILVTAPFLLLLLDFWPLQRFPPVSPNSAWFLQLVREKVPFFALALLSSLVTYAVQAHMHAVTIALPLWPRFLNAIVSYLKYLGMTLWPAELAVFYPHPDTRWPVSEQWPIWAVALAFAGLAALSAAAFVNRKRFPWLFMGWFWYFGMLVPVIGIVQVGGQALADRYTYIPLIGVFICIAWGAAEILKKRRHGSAALAMLAAVVVLGSAVLSHAQTRLWKNDFTLFGHALAVTKNNAVAHCHLGSKYGERGEYEKAMAHFRQAITAAPALPDGYFGLGYTFELQGKREEALEQYGVALRLKPWDGWIHLHMGVVLSQLGKKEQAMAHYLEAVRLNPDSPEGRFTLGQAFAEKNELAAAATHLAEAVRLSPGNREAILRLAETLLGMGNLGAAEARFRHLLALDANDPDAHINIGGVLWMRGQRQEALAEYATAVRLKPDYPIAHFNLGTALLSQDRFAEAAASFSEAARLKPDYAAAISGLGRSLSAQGRYDEAIPVFERSLAVKRDPSTLYSLGLAQASRRRFKPAADSFREVLKSRPDWVPALNELAWLLATAPDAAARNGAEAVKLAERASEIAEGKDPRLLATLAAAHAEAGRFQEAVTTAEKARELAVAIGMTEVARTVEERIADYRKGQAYHTP
jgi:tetratricopeptide (TPR) repeat protein